MMSRKELTSRIDHTLLKPCSTWEQIIQLCQEAIYYETASVCIPPSFVRRVKRTYGEALTICTVIGFPLGYSSTASKVYEAMDAIINGADEIDMVVNIGNIKNGDFDSVRKEISQIRSVCMGKILKVIIETCYLTEQEKIEMCRIVNKTDVEYIKTSTGFGDAGANPDDIRLFKKYISPLVKIKASGGIRTLEDLQLYAELGCDRIGCSSTAKIFGENK